MNERELEQKYKRTNERKKKSEFNSNIYKILIFQNNISK
jgi:hypothetical protein